MVISLEFLRKFASGKLVCLIDILEDRRAPLDTHVKAGVVTEVQAGLLDEILGRLQIWVVLTTSADKQAVTEPLASSRYRCDVFSIQDVAEELEKLGRGA